MGRQKPLADLLTQKSAKEVSKLCLTESKLTSPTYNISETAINELAYQLLQEKKLQDALVFLNLTQNCIRNHRMFMTVTENVC